MPRGAVIAISHGGGPMPVLGDPGHAQLVASLREKVPARLRLNTPSSAPRAIVVVTAHWSTAQPTVSSGPSHRLYYDYGGFPAEAYRLQYPAPGEPAVAREVKRVLDAAGFATVLDAERGWDHGVFIPFLLIHPAADIPIVQLSVLRSEDAEAHLRMGRALAQLRDANVAIVGSGFASFHNLRLFSALMAPGGPPDELLAANKAFNAAVTKAVTGTDGDDNDEDDDERENKKKKDEDEDEDEDEEQQRARARALEGWRGFPGAYAMHPRGGAEHFLPLLVCAGAGMGRGRGYVDGFRGLDIWSYYWE